MASRFAGPILGLGLLLTTPADASAQYRRQIDEPPPAFRYGDTRPLRKNYLPGDFLADALPCGVAKSVHMEAEWDPADPVGETRWIAQLAGRHGFPHACVAQAWLDRDDAQGVLAAQASFPLVRGVRHKPGPGAMRTPRWRQGYALLERHGLHFELQAPWGELTDAADLASAVPRTGFLGRRRPIASRTAYGTPSIRCHTPKSMPAAWTRTITSSARGRGRCT